MPAASHSGCLFGHFQLKVSEQLTLFFLQDNWVSKNSPNWEIERILIMQTMVQTSLSPEGY